MMRSHPRKLLYIAIVLRSIAVIDSDLINADEASNVHCAHARAIRRGAAIRGPWPWRGLPRGALSPALKKLGEGGWLKTSEV